MKTQTNTNEIKNTNKYTIIIEDGKIKVDDGDYIETIEKIQTNTINKEEFKKDFNSESSQISNAQLLKKYGFNSVKEMCEYARVNNLMIIKPQTEEDKKHLSLLAEGLKDAMTILNETEKEPFTSEEQTDLNLSKVAKGKAKRLNK